MWSLHRTTISPHAQLECTHHISFRPAATSFVKAVFHLQFLSTRIESSFVTGVSGKGALPPGFHLGTLAADRHHIFPPGRLRRSVTNTLQSDKKKRTYSWVRLHRREPSSLPLPPLPPLPSTDCEPKAMVRFSLLEGTSRRHPFIIHLGIQQCQTAKNVSSVMRTFFSKQEVMKTCC